jgi:hypothetical protein
MQQEASRGTMIALIAAAVVLVVGIGWYFMSGQHMPSRGDPNAVSKPPGGGGYAGAFQRSHPPR